jgi:hypothetical protein
MVRVLSVLVAAEDPLGEVEVEHELICVAHRRKGGDGDRAALLRCQLNAFPASPNRRCAPDGSLVSDIRFLFSGGAGRAASLLRFW